MELTYQRVHSGYGMAVRTPYGCCVALGFSGSGYVGLMPVGVPIQMQHDRAFAVASLEAAANARCPELRPGPLHTARREVNHRHGARRARHSPRVNR
jgi:hypothetical protein